MDVQPNCEIFNLSAFRSPLAHTPSLLLYVPHTAVESHMVVNLKKRIPWLAQKRKAALFESCIVAWSLAAKWEKSHIFTLWYHPSTTNTIYGYGEKWDVKTIWSLSPSTSRNSSYDEANEASGMNHHECIRATPW